MTTTKLSAPFPGGVGLTRLKVYDWEAADGACGGSPHMHTASTEAYFVLAGTGRVETIRTSGYDSFELSANDVLWFSPGTIHRLVNDGDLEILAIMQNGGLPEAGDAVLTFDAEIVADPVRYARTASLTGGAPSDSLQDAARARRDAALAGYQRLKEAAIAGEGEYLTKFQQDAVRLIHSRVPEWKSLWEETIAPESTRTAEWLDELAQGQFSHFADATVARSDANRPGAIFGMCGTLQKWDTGRVL
ncbi:cupin domain-containing protein [Paenarthrobacter nitroguajacolicus]|uniref:cupin domain-containing protein n=1 Tax=Paenarthrobacter nitroguajacolicus TaxID=211146 RepID=UPI0040549088